MQQKMQKMQQLHKINPFYNLYLYKNKYSQKIILSRYRFCALDHFNYITIISYHAGI